MECQHLSAIFSNEQSRMNVEDKREREGGGGKEIEIESTYILQTHMYERNIHSSEPKMGLECKLC